MSEWRKTNLGSLTNKIGSGSTPRGGGNAYKEKGISLVRSQNVLDFAFTYSGLAFIDDHQAEKLKNVELRENDILLNITGDSVARCCIVDKTCLPARVNQHVAIVRPIHNRADFRFIFYYLQYLKPELLSQAEIGATRRALTKGMLESLEIHIPNNCEEQKAISEILTSLDDKIDLLHRQNQTLEALAETLFRHTFIDNAQDVWETIELGSVIQTTSGGTPSRKKMKYYEGGIINWVKSKELSGSFITDTEEHITQEALKNSSAKILPKHAILIAMYGATVGEYAIISREMTCNQAVCALKPNDSYPYTFLFLFIKSMKQELINMAVGSAQQNISQILIKQLPIIKPNEKIAEFHNLIEAKFLKIESNIEQIKTLENLRDTLLPKLMSGEVRVEYETMTTKN